jgi:hypothetical protein
MQMPPGRRTRRKTAAEKTRKFTRPIYRALTLAHDPEKWEPVFGKDHAQGKVRDGSASV